MHKLSPPDAGAGGMTLQAEGVQRFCKGKNCGERTKLEAAKKGTLSGNKLTM